MRGDPWFEAVADPDEASSRDADSDPPPEPEEAESVVPDPERMSDSKTASVDPETASVKLEPALVESPVRSDTIVVCEVIVEIADVTVPIGSTTCAPAAAAPLETPPTASRMKIRTRMAAVLTPFCAYPLSEQQNS